MMTQTEDEPLNDKNVRDAINGACIDTDALAEALDDQVSPLYGFDFQGSGRIQRR